MKIRFFIITAASALLLAACGGEDPEPAPSPGPDPGPTPPAVEEEVRIDPSALYNGIVLPAQWPMRRNAKTDIRKGMDPFYLSDKPAVIYATAGRQLFVDNFLIKNTSLRRVYHYPEIAATPVMVPDREWEVSANGKSRFAAPFSDGVWYDEADGKFKMWYMGATDVTCYAESSDGINWTKPSLDVVSGTNIIRRGTTRDAVSIWLDKEGVGERYRMFEVSGGAGNWRYKYLTSADGIHWRDRQAESEKVADRSTVYYSPFRKVWVWSMRHNVRVNSSDPYTVRARDYMENSDPVAGNKRAQAHLDYFWFGPWPNERRWEQNIDNDGAPGIYNQDAMPYESVMLGFFSVWQGPENDVCNRLNMVKRNQIMLGYSRDGGYSWQRDDMAPFIPIADNTYYAGNLQSALGSPVIVGDKLYFYFSARRMEGKTEVTTTGLATLRRDGFASMSGDGTLTTEKLLLSGSTLWVNARIGGSLKVEVLNSKGEVLDRFTTTLTATDGCRIKVTDGLEDAVRNKAVSLRFTMQDGDLYSFWVGDAEGHSNGYTAGGGPGLSPSGIDK